MIAKNPEVQDIIEALKNDQIVAAFKDKTILKALINLDISELPNKAQFFKHLKEGTRLEYKWDNGKRGELVRKIYPNLEVHEGEFIYMYQGRNYPESYKKNEAFDEP